MSVINIKIKFFKYTAVLLVGFFVGLCLMYAVYLSERKSQHGMMLHSELALIQQFNKNGKPVTLENRRARVVYILDFIKKDLEHTFNRCDQDMKELLDKAKSMDFEVPICD